MKTQFLIRGVMLSVITIGALNGCSDVEDTIKGTSCENALTASQCNGNTIDACADIGGGWYEVNGEEVCSFNSDPTYCAQQVVAEYCSSNRSANRFEEDLLEELLVTKSSNIDLQNKVNDLMDAINQDINASNKEEPVPQNSWKPNSKTF